MDKEQFSAAPPRGKVTRLRRDMRLRVIGGLRAAGLLIMLGTLIYAVFAWRDALTFSGLRQLLAYAHAAGGEAEGLVSYPLEPGLDTVCAPLELGLAVASPDGYRFVSGGGEVGFSMQLAYSAPEICVGDRQALVYDRGNTGYCVVNGYAALHTGTLGSPIIAACMNPGGDYAFVTNESGYRAGGYVFDSRSREICVWQTPDYFILHISLSPDGGRFAAFCLSESGGQALGQVRVYDAGQPDPAFTVDMGDAEVYALRHDGAGNLYILAADGLMIYSPDGSLAANVPLSGVVRFRQHEGDAPMVAVRGTGSGPETVIVTAYDSAGQTVLSETFQGSLRDLDYRAGRGMLLFYGQLTIIDATGDTPVTETREALGARTALCGASGRGGLISSGRAEGLPLDVTTG
jgi:hypothetical protein